MSKGFFYNIIFFLGGLVILIFIINSHVNVSFDKKHEVFIQLLGLPQKKYIKDRQDSIQLIKKIVRTISNYGSLESLPKGVEKNLKSFYFYKKGLCFDRSIIYEQIFSYYGLKTHHYFLAFNDNIFTTIFSKNTISHTLVSVMVGGNEVFIDTNNYFVSVDSDGKPIVDFLKRVTNENFKSPALWWNVYFKKYKYYLIIRGLYSRNGDFFQSIINTPEINFFDLKFEQ